MERKFYKNPFKDICWNDPFGSGCDSTCPLCKKKTGGYVYGDYNLCEKCVRNAANYYVYQTSGEYDWRFASKQQIDEQEQARKAYRQKQKKTIPASLRTAVFERDGYKCLACGSQKSLRCDHVLPESKGGPMDASNMQTLCASCNSRKGTKHIDYRKDLGN